MNKWKQLFVRIAKWGWIYSAAAAIDITVFAEISGGNPHVPFTMFPAYLLLAPIAPIGLVIGLILEPAWDLVGYLALFVALFLFFWWVHKRFISRKER